MKYFWELEMVNLSDEEILTKAHIRNLVEYDRYCCDYGHKDEERKLWFMDGQLFTTWFRGSITDYLSSTSASTGQQPEPHPMEHHAHRINNTVVWLKGSKAIAEVLCTLNFRTRLGWEWVDLQCWCRMHYRVENRDGHWGIVYFEGIYEKDRIDPVFGDSQFAIPREVLQQYRPNNWNMAVRRDLFGNGLRNAGEWAGPDRPETIERLYRESSEWMEVR